MSTDGVDTGDLPDPTTYDRLVDRFLDPEADDREAVRARLEADADSSIAVVRYYAVDAMAKLGKGEFGEALLRAADDEDPAIRGLAVGALED